jgi:ribonuclease P protein component
LALDKREKLKDRRVFKNTRSFSNLIKHSSFKLIAQRARNQFHDSLPFVAFVISKKKIKLAVSRNKAKRRTEEAYRLCKKEIDKDILNKFTYLIFFLEEEILKTPFEQIKDLIKKAIIR